LDDDEPDEHNYDLVFGFRRYAALRSLDREELRIAQPNVEVSISEPMTDEQADDANFVENFVRRDPSECEWGRYIRSRMTKEGPTLTAEVAAKRWGAPSPYRVESCVRIVSRFPDDILTEWEAHDSDKRYRRALDRISRVIDPNSRLPQQDRHERMRQMFAQYQERFTEQDEERAVQAAEDEEDARNGAGFGGGGKGRSKSSARRRAEEAERVLDTSGEFYDTAVGAWTPITGRERYLVRAFLRYVGEGRRVDLKVR
jgi:hypothetical protein